MCDYFWERMEKEQGGDLADIVRAGGHGMIGSDIPMPDVAAGWQQLPSSDPIAFPTPLSDDFGNPFINARDPLFDEFADSMPGGRQLAGDVTLTAVEELKPQQQQPCNNNSNSNNSSSSSSSIFSRVVQISPPRPIKPSPVMAEVDGMTGVQISSPRNPGIKRRKSQAKKVVCIPAPAAAAGGGGGRPGGEVVPSDLWAWRKYGQKPIKGSPYPRGYYRCSSSKGCSARKQVERSRTDPNMLVVTYTSEHNHPWPTQRNALAGSTRSQPLKNSSSASKSSSQSQKAQQTSIKEEPMASVNNINPIVKEEAHEMEKAMDVADQDSELHHQVFHQSYKPMIPESGQPDDFFADLAELESDPMSLIFSKELMETKGDEERGDEALDDAFNLFEWEGGSFGEAKKGL